MSCLPYGYGTSKKHFWGISFPLLQPVISFIWSLPRGCDYYWGQGGRLTAALLLHSTLFSPKQTRRRTRLLQTQPQSVNFLFHSFLTRGSNLFQTLILRAPKQNTASWLHLKILPMKIMKRIRDSPLRTCPTRWRQCGPGSWNCFWTLLSNTFTTKHLLLTLSVILERSNKYMLNNKKDFTTISKSK